MKDQRQEASVFAARRIEDHQTLKTPKLTQKECRARETFQTAKENSEAIFAAQSAARSLVASLEAVFHTSIGAGYLHEADFAAREHAQVVGLLNSLDRIRF